MAVETTTAFQCPEPAQRLASNPSVSGKHIDLKLPQHEQRWQTFTVIGLDPETGVCRLRKHSNSLPAQNGVVGESVRVTGGALAALSSCQTNGTLQPTKTSSHTSVRIDNLQATNETPTNVNDRIDKAQKEQLVNASCCSNSPKSNVENELGVTSHPFLGSRIPSDQHGSQSTKSSCRDGVSLDTTNVVDAVLIASGNGYWQSASVNTDCTQRIPLLWRFSEKNQINLPKLLSNSCLFENQRISIESGGQWYENVTIVHVDQAIDKNVTKLQLGAYYIDYNQMETVLVDSRLRFYSPDNDLIQWKFATQTKRKRVRDSQKHKVPKSVKQQKFELNNNTTVTSGCNEKVVVRKHLLLERPFEVLWSDSAWYPATCNSRNFGSVDGFPVYNIVYPDEGNSKEPLVVFDDFTGLSIQNFENGIENAKVDEPFRWRWCGEPHTPKPFKHDSIRLCRPPDNFEFPETIFISSRSGSNPIWKSFKVQRIDSKHSLYRAVQQPNESSKTVVQHHGMTVCLLDNGMAARYRGTKWLTDQFLKWKFPTCVLFSCVDGHNKHGDTVTSYRLCTALQERPIHYRTISGLLNAMLDRGVKFQRSMWKPDAKVLDCVDRSTAIIRAEKLLHTTSKSTNNMSRKQPISVTASASDGGTTSNNSDDETGCSMISVPDGSDIASVRNPNHVGSLQDPWDEQLVIDMIEKVHLVTTSQDTGLLKKKTKSLIKRMYRSSWCWIQQRILFQSPNSFPPSETRFCSKLIFQDKRKHIMKPIPDFDARLYQGDCLVGLQEKPIRVHYRRRNETSIKVSFMGPQCETNKSDQPQVVRSKRAATNGNSTISLSAQEQNRVVVDVNSMKDTHYPVTADVLRRISLHKLRNHSFNTLHSVDPLASGIVNCTATSGDKPLVQGRVETYDTATMKLVNDSVTDCKNTVVANCSVRPNQPRTGCWNATNPDSRFIATMQITDLDVTIPIVHLTNVGADLATSTVTQLDSRTASASLDPKTTSAGYVSAVDPRVTSEESTNAVDPRTASASLATEVDQRTASAGLANAVDSKTNAVDPRTASEKSANFREKSTSKGSTVPRDESKLDFNVLDTSSFLFSFSLFRVGFRKKANKCTPSGPDKDNFKYYARSALDFVCQNKNRFPTCKFVLHTDYSLSPKLLLLFHNLAKGDIKICQYYDATQAKPGLVWLINAMRFRTMWEHDGPEIVVVSDIHDDLATLHAQMAILVQALRDSNRMLAVTFWESDDADCVSSSPIPLKPGCHYHIDGGVGLWCPGTLRQQVNSVHQGEDFIHYCCGVLQDADSIPRGIDEMLVDAFLAPCGVYAKALMFPHKHHIRPNAPKLNFVSDDVLCSILGRGEECNQSMKELELLNSVNVERVELPIGSLGGESVYVCHERVIGI